MSVCVSDFVEKCNADTQKWSGVSLKLAAEWQDKTDKFISFFKQFYFYFVAYLRNCVYSVNWLNCFPISSTFNNVFFLIYRKGFCREIPILISNRKCTLIQSSLDIREFRKLKNRRQHAMDAYIHTRLVNLDVPEIKYKAFQKDLNDLNLVYFTY